MKIHVLSQDGVSAGSAVLRHCIYKYVVALCNPSSAQARQHGQERTGCRYHNPSDSRYIPPEASDQCRSNASRIGTTLSIHGNRDPNLLALLSVFSTRLFDLPVIERSFGEAGDGRANPDDRNRSANVKEAKRCPTR